MQKLTISKRRKPKSDKEESSVRMLREAIESLGAIVERADPDSAFNGLKIVAGAFSALLQVYALPNTNNPVGMCDDPRAFRRYFAEMVATVAEPASQDPEASRK